MHDFLVYKYQKKNIPSLAETLIDNEKIVLNRALILVGICHAHLIHGARKFEWNHIQRNYVVKSEDKELLDKNITRFRKQCMRCQRKYLIVMSPLNINEFGDEARKVLYMDFVFINTHGWYSL
eukprot:snap_masked-scaffold_30-processed-gene-2.8-mRNA-1 protein AED:1.00 eAED:1.00 QI:0/0/0/0/1/1/2/0/122